MKDGKIKMMWSEFVKGTGCKENEKNRALYEALEKIYMEREDLTKDQIYQAAAPLLDNSKSSEEIQAEKEKEEKIQVLTVAIKENEKMIAGKYSELSLWYGDDPNMVKEIKDSIKYLERQLKNWKAELKILAA